LIERAVEVRYFAVPFALGVLVVILITLMVFGAFLFKADPVLVVLFGLACQVLALKVAVKDGDRFYSFETRGLMPGDLAT
jgi:type IV secretory pathway TrbL component